MSGAQKIVRVEVGGTVGVPHAHVYTHTQVCAHTHHAHALLVLKLEGGLDKKAALVCHFLWSHTYVLNIAIFFHSFHLYSTLKSVRK